MAIAPQRKASVCKIVVNKRQLVTVRVAYIGAVETFTIVRTVSRFAFIRSAESQRKVMKLLDFLARSAFKAVPLSIVVALQISFMSVLITQQPGQE